MIEKVISVTFEDATDVSTQEVRQDIVGIPFDYYWGPANKVRRMSRLEFLREFPEVQPLGVSFTGPRVFMHSYAAAKRLLDMGADTIECVRVVPDEFVKYWGIKLLQPKPNGNNADERVGFFTLGRVAAGKDELVDAQPYAEGDLKTFGSGASLGANACALRLKYPGMVPSTFGYSTLAVDVQLSGEVTMDENHTGLAPITIKLIGITNGEETVVEKWEGSFDKNCMIDGTSFYIGDVLQKSKWLEFDNYSDGSLAATISGLSGTYATVVEAIAESGTPGQEGYQPAVPGSTTWGKTVRFIYDPSTATHWSDDLNRSFMGRPALAPGHGTTGTGVGTYATANNYIDVFLSAYDSAFGDMEASKASILCPAFSDRKIYRKCQELAKAKKYLTTVVGCEQNTAITTPIEDTEASKTAIEDYHDSLEADKFSTMITGCEILTVFGSFRLFSDCVASFIGRTVAVANVVNLNQPASAKAYGLVKTDIANMSLVKAFNFDNVLQLHDKGIGCIYNAYAGPTIWNIRTLHPRAQSYYAKWNVMRVTAAILRSIMELAVMGIHTAVAADDGLRSTFEEDCNKVLALHATAGNIKNKSWADVSATLNNEIDTRKGEVLLIELHLWFIKLTEEVKIKVIATDSTVTAELQ